jgi:cell division transport system permease protein
MAKKRKNTYLFKIINSYVTTTISITLLLFLLGLISLMYLTSDKISNYVKENISFTVFIKDDAKEADILKLQKLIDAKPYVKSTLYITKDMAADQLKKDLGESFLELLTENPLPPSIEVKYKAEYAVPDSIDKIAKDISKYPIVDEMYYQKDLIYLVHKNLNTIGFFIMILSLFLLIIAIALINNTIRLLVYSKRFLIKSMQLIGATNGFIKVPFIIKAVYQGFISSILAILLLSTLIFYLQNNLSDIINFYEPKILGITFGFILISGLLITFLSSFFAVNKYLRLKISDLYSY